MGKRLEQMCTELVKKNTAHLREDNSVDKVFTPTDSQKLSFEKWAKTQNCNLTPSPYPESFRTYKFDRTQHMLEGWLAALDNKGDKS